MSLPIEADISDVRSIDVEADPLLVRLQARDAGAFEELVRREGGRMLAVAKRLLADDDDAQDAVQDAFLSAFRSLPRFDGRSKLSTWLYRIAVNASLMKLRQRKTLPASEESLNAYDGTGHRLEPVNRWDLAPAEQVDRDETRRIVREEIDELPEIHRTVLVLRDIEEWDTLQAAAALAVSENVVKVRLHRARLALRERLEKRMIGGKS